jgi:hypothetical protein
MIRTRLIPTRELPDISGLNVKVPVLPFRIPGRVTIPEDTGRLSLSGREVPVEPGTADAVTVMYPARVAVLLPEALVTVSDTVWVPGPVYRYVTFRDVLSVVLNHDKEASPKLQFHIRGVTTSEVSLKVT